MAAFSYKYDVLMRLYLSGIAWYSLGTYSSIVNVFFALGAILGRAVAFASPVTLGTTATDLVLCILTVEIAETCAIAKTTPFVTQPTESALAHRDSWAKSKL